MEKQINVVIPYFCYCCSKGAIKRSNQAHKKFSKAKSIKFSDVEFIKNLFNQKKRELYNPETFFNLIYDIFRDFENEYRRESWIYINSIKRLISLTAKELQLPEIKVKSTTFMVITDIEVWFDFLDRLHHYLSEIDGIYAVKYSKNKRVAFCLGNLTEVMISEIEDYWNQQSF
jgi:hypothetical protein